MKYILVLLSALIIIFGVIFVLKQSEEKNTAKAPKTEETANIAALIKQLKPLIDEVSLKNFQNDEKVYEKYKNQLMMIDALSEQIIDNIADINIIKDYDYAEYITLRYSIKMDLLSILSVMTPSQYNNLTDEIIAKSLFKHVDLFFTPLASLYDENINVKDYLSAYKEPYYNNEHGMQEYRRQLSFLGNAQKITDTLNFSENDNKTKNKLIDNAAKSYVLYSINSGLYDNIDQFSQWEIFRNKYIIDDYQQKFLNNLYKYKSVKALKNVYLAKIYMQFMMLDDKYISGLSNIEQMEQEYPEEFYEESTLFVSGCTNPEYLFEDTLNKCVDFIKNADTKDDAFSYLEDENIAGYVMINDKLCATKDDYGYKFYNNDNIMCNTLKEKLGYKGKTNIEEIADYIDEMRPFIDNVTKQAAEVRAIGGKIESTIFMDGIVLSRLVDKAVQSVYEVTRLKKYDKDMYEIIRHCAKRDLIVYVHNLKQPESKEIAAAYIFAVKLYTDQIYNLYKSGINAGDFLKNYTMSDKMIEEINSYNLQTALPLARNITTKYNINEEDKSVMDSIFKDWFHSIIDYALLTQNRNNNDNEVWENILLFSNPNENIYKNMGKLLKYRMVRITRSVYLSKIYADLFAVDNAYLSKAEQIFINDAGIQEYLKNTAANQNTKLSDACSNTKYLTKNRQTECINIIKDKSGDEAFAFLEDSNIKGYVIINDMVCAAKDNTGYKFYDNDDIMCKTLKEKLGN